MKAKNFDVVVRNTINIPEYPIDFDRFINPAKMDNETINGWIDEIVPIAAKDGMAYCLSGDSLVLCVDEGDGFSYYVCKNYEMAFCSKEPE